MPALDDARDKTFTALDFDFVKKNAASFAKSGEAAERVMNITPLSNEREVLNLQKQITLIARRILSKDNESRNELPAIKDAILKLGIEGLTLSQSELFYIGVFIEEAERVVKWLFKDESTRRELQEFIESIPSCTLIADDIFAILERDGSLKNLPRFAQIKSDIASVEHEIQNITASFASGEETKTMLRSKLPSLRSGRTVIALKSNFKGRIKGIVHEISDTGQTIFLEPESLVEKNNELNILRLSLEIEIKKVLRVLSGTLALNKALLLQFHKKIIHLETLRARAHYAAATGGVFSALPASARLENNAPFIKLVNAYHPVLKADARPLNIEIKSSIRALIITGPNAGGKTVLLKTAGLFALMNQSGIALPAGDGTVLPVFDAVHIALGDEQTIEGSLSTFSSRIKTIADIYRHATGRSLVLLDELGSATESEEGAALAMAISDAFINKRCMTLITTHHNVLKNYAAEKEEAENASLEFDSASMLPTYRVIMGVPGRSMAFAAARAAKLPLEIIKQSERYLESGGADTAKLISALQERELSLEREKEFVERERRVVDGMKNQNDALASELRGREIELKEKYISAMDSLLREQRREFENIVRLVKENPSRENILSGKEFFKRGGEQLAVLEEERVVLSRAAEDAAARTSEERAEDDAPRASFEIREGDVVLAGKDKREGVVRRRGKKGCWMVEVGRFTLPFPENEIFPAKNRPKKPLKPDIMFASLAEDAPLYEIDLHGLHLDEALLVLEKQIDRALVASLRQFSVIHGKGDGVLSKGVHNYLKTHGAVADYYFARPEFGGTGRTEVILK